MRIDNKLIKRYLINEVRERFARLMFVNEKEIFNISEALFMVHSSKVYKDMGYEKFSDFIRNETNIDIRMAQIHIKIFKYYVFIIGCGDEKIFNYVKTLGFSRLQHCIGIINEKNYIEEVKKLSNMSVRDVKKYKYSISKKLPKNKKLKQNG